MERGRGTGRVGPGRVEGFLSLEVLGTSCRSRDESRKSPERVETGFVNPSPVRTSAQDDFLRLVECLSTVC